MVKDRLPEDIAIALGFAPLPPSATNDALTDEDFAPIEEGSFVLEPPIAPRPGDDDDADDDADVVEDGEEPAAPEEATNGTFL